MAFGALLTLLALGLIREELQISRIAVLTMRVLPGLSVLVAAATLSDASSVPRALAETSAPANASSNATDAAAIAALRKYYGSDVDKLTPTQLQQLVQKLHAEAPDPGALQALLEDSKDWFAKVGDSIKTIFTGKDDNNNEGGVFSKMWKSLFGNKSGSGSKGGAATHGSGSGSMAHDVGGSAGVDATITKNKKDTKSAGSSTEDTSIDTVAPAPAPTPTPTPSKTTPKSSSSAKLLTSLPVAGTLAAIFVINFVQ
jgi:hypothetical protein